MGKSNEHSDLGALIEAALRQMNFTDTISKTKVEDAYHKVVGDFIDRLTWGVRFDSHAQVLRVSLASPALKKELSFKVSDLIAAINNFVGGPAVKQIIFL